MKVRYMITTIMIFICIFSVTSMTCLAFQFQDPAGDTFITDITNMNYQVTDEALEIVLDFVTIYSDTFVTIKIDIDRSLVTGFTGGCGSREPSRFGADYMIRVEMGTLPISTEVYLRYERFTSDPTQPIIEIETVKIPIGNPFQPNGSIFQQTANQMYLKIPLQLFNNDLYPLYTPNTRTCVREFFPYPSGLTPDVKRAYVNVRTEILYYIGDYDQLPNQGMIDAETGKPADSYAMGGDDLVDVIYDDPNDSVLSGILGDEITALQAYMHNDGNISLALELSSIEYQDDSLYALNLDIDDNPSTGIQVSNGSVTIGADITAQFQTWSWIVSGQVTPLYGEFCFGDNFFCDLPYSHLGYLFLGSPGYVWTVIPKKLMEPFLSSNKSGVIKIIGHTLSPGWPHVTRDVVPNTGCLEIEILALQGDLDSDGDVDGLDLAVFAADFGRGDCDTGEPCEGDFDGNNAVDSVDLDIFTGNFGQTQ